MEKDATLGGRGDWFPTAMGKGKSVTFSAFVTLEAHPGLRLNIFTFVLSRVFYIGAQFDSGVLRLK
jgi:hypothetical protein